MLGKINWSPSKRDIRIFGLVLIAGFGVISLILMAKGLRPLAERLFAGAVAVGLLSIAVPAMGGLFYRLWMGIGVCVGFVVSRVILAVIFFCILTPVSLVFRLMRRDALGIKRKAESSYWADLPAESKDDHQHLF